MPSPHWLRHACASHSLDRGAPAHVVQQTLGHASLATTNCTQIDSYGDDLHFLRRTILATVGVAAFVEFFVTLYVMSLPGELVYQFVVAALSLMVAMASQKPKYKPVKVFCERVLVLIGLALLAFASRQVYLHWHQLDVREVLLDFALPVWLTVGWVPFLYLYGSGRVTSAGC